MVKSLFLLLIFSIFTIATPHIAYALENCANPSFQEGFPHSAINFGNIDYTDTPPQDPRQTPQNADRSLWLKRILPYSPAALPTTEQPAENHSGECNFDTALEILDELEIQTHSSNNSYIKFWINNQNIVLESCINGTRLPLTEPQENAPERAAADFAYQQAALRFYTRNNSELVELEETFLRQAQQPHSAMQGRAAIMALRLAFMNRGLEHMVDMASALRSNPLTTEAYAYAEDTVFTAYWDYNQTVTTEGATKRLQWLVDIALERNIPLFSKTTSTQQSYRYWRQKDAQYQLNQLISPGRLYDPLIEAGWWFSEIVQDDPDKESVRIVAQKEPYIDFLATHFIRTPLSSWRWALYDQSNPVWAKSQIIAHHALNRFCNGEGIEWLYEAARILPPNDPEAQWTQSQLINALDDRGLYERQPLLRGKIYQQAVRLNLMLDNDNKAFELLQRQDINFNEIKGRREHQIPSYQTEHNPNTQLQTILTDTYKETLNWFAHQGRWEEARTVLSLYNQIKEHYSLYDYYTSGSVESYRFMLAKDLSDTLETLLDLSASDAQANLILFDLLPTKKLVDILADLSARQNMRENIGQLLSSRLIMRSWILEKEDLLQRIAPLYATYFPNQKDEVLRFAAGDRFERALFALRHQNNPFSSTDLYSLTESSLTSDLYNWGGLWCRFSPDDYNSAVMTLWEFAPDGAPSSRSGWFWSGYETGLQYDQKQFAAKRQDAISQHPLLQLTDRSELQQLETVASGAQYISSIIVSYAQWPRIWNRMRGRLDEMPEALHLATRTARFGCHRNGDTYRKISRQAYTILQKDFSDSIWAKMTPYWYN